MVFSNLLKHVVSHASTTSRTITPSTIPDFHHHHHYITRHKPAFRPAGPRWIVERVQFSWENFSHLASRLRRSARRVSNFSYYSRGCHFFVADRQRCRHSIITIYVIDIYIYHHHICKCHIQCMHSWEDLIMILKSE